MGVSGSRPAVFAPPCVHSPPPKGDERMQYLATGTARFDIPGRTFDIPGQLGKTPRRKKTGTRRCR
ncbi:hypothetical protein CBM2587_B90701 [Cupriavidus taiwanensis]|uniref:Uncharacterized protein n=1 Tax=Cupriavidus taiwanensis TaxID=164546 RepID=A0A975XHS5_9BURK|nr:hypothetical protein CBM2587_B90701 [Cupriavidus taiwanensis]